MTFNKYNFNNQYFVKWQTQHALELCIIHPIWTTLSYINDKCFYQAYEVN